jgi:hypothetical protein
VAKESGLDGFVNLTVFISVESGTVLELRTEAYLVPGMSVPILLGEDFQQVYELSVRRSLEEGTRVEVAHLKEEFRALPVDRDYKLPSGPREARHAQAFVHAKTSRRQHASHRKRVKEQNLLDRTLRLAHDVTLPEGTYKLVEVTCRAMERMPDSKWVLERLLLANADDLFFPVPNVLFSSKVAWIPIANTSQVPRTLRKGEIISEATDPQKFFAAPTEEKEHLRLEEAAIRTSMLVRALMKAEEEKTTDQAGEPAREQDSAGSGSTPPPGPSSADKEETTSGGPKTAEMPEMETYSLAELRNLLDLGDIPEHLKEEAWAMLERNTAAFGFDERLGHHPALARIRTKEGTKPIAVPMYGTSPAKKEVIEAQVNKWIEAEVIEPSRSPWRAPVVIAYRNGKARFCVDYRKLNAATIADEYPIPRQSEILGALGGATVLLSLDALAGFTQLGMHPDNVEKTVFPTHMGLFQFKRMLFGLQNGPSIFQRVMQGVLAPYLWLFCLVYIDDIVVYSTLYEDHLVHLETVLTAIREAGLTLSPKKCHMFYSLILLLGHKVSRLGLSTHEEKVRAILELEQPTRLSQLQTFLGMVVYFSAFIPYYSDMVGPLFALLRKGARWNWGATEEHAFECAKNALRRAPVLGHPERGWLYRLYTDASDDALGCVLQQVQTVRAKDLQGTKAYEKLKKAFDSGAPVPKLVSKIKSKADDDTYEDKWALTLDETEVHVERVIAYYSRTFKDSEKRYSITEREALGAKEGLIKFQPYIEGEKVLLVTDHSALQWARTYENSNRRLAAWGAIYSAYAPGLEIIHRAGRIHSNVDPLSRLPRVPPENTLAARNNSTPLIPDNSTAAHLRGRPEVARKATVSFCAAHVSDLVDDAPDGMNIFWGNAFAVMMTRTGQQTKDADRLINTIVGKTPRRPKRRTKRSDRTEPEGLDRLPV